MLVKNDAAGYCTPAEKINFSKSGSRKIIAEKIIF
jgi:hypothetical protein